MAVTRGQVTPCSVCGALPTHRYMNTDLCEAHRTDRPPPPPYWITRDLRERAPTGGCPRTWSTARRARAIERELAEMAAERNRAARAQILRDRGEEPW